MSAYGYADGQAITGWLGVPLVATAGLALGAGTHVDGPFALTNFASIIVAIKPTGGPVTLRVQQAISGGPAALVLEEDLVVTAGETVFQAFVLFGDAVTVELDGSVGGTTVDYAIYPSNTTTNAQVIQAATINVQHNDALVGTEQTLDFEDPAGGAWTIADDGPNQRIKITPPAPGQVVLGEVLLAAPVAAITFTGIPQTLRHLELFGQVIKAVAGHSLLGMQVNGLTGTVYGGAYDGIGTDVPSEFALTFFPLCGSWLLSAFRAAILNYTRAVLPISMVADGGETFDITTLPPPNGANGMGHLSSYGYVAGAANLGAVTQVKVFDTGGSNLGAGSLVTLYGK